MKTTAKVLAGLLLSTAALSAYADNTPATISWSTGDGAPYVTVAPKDERSFAQAQNELVAQLKEERTTYSTPAEVEGMPVTFDNVAKDNRSFKQAQQELISNLKAGRQHPSAEPLVFWSVSGT